MPDKKETQDGTYLTGKLLLAMPTLGDPRFHRAVILMCAHDEHGAMGLVVNHQMADIKFEHLLKQINLASDIQVDPDKLSLHVMSGGPVDPARGFLLHGSDFSTDDTIKINDEYFVTGTVDSLKKAVQKGGPDKMCFILGYAGWGAGQLDAEIQQNAWLVVDADPDLVFSSDIENAWSRAVQKLGFDPAMLSGDAGRA